MATYKSTLRSMNAAVRRAERNAARRQRELANRQKEAAKLHEQERARLEVDVFENHLEVITSLHVECGPSFDWAAIHTSKPPQRGDESTFRAQQALDRFKPSRIRKRSSAEEQKRLQAELLQAQADDQQRYLSDLEEHERLVELAAAVLGGDSVTYAEVLREFLEAGEIAALGEHFNIRVTPELRVHVTLNAHSSEIVPAEMKSLLQSGKLSTKKMPVTRRWGIYQDYVCSAALRVARDIMALLPLDMVLVTVTDELLNTSTGLMENEPILSVAFARSTLARLNLERLDPSDSMENFVHNMNFKKTKGFVAIEPLELAQFT